MSYQILSIARLQEKANAIRGWLGNRLEAIRELRQHRDAALAEQARSIADLRAQAGAALGRVQDLQDRAAALRAEAVKLDGLAADQLTWAASFTERAEDAERTAASLKRFWRQELLNIQDGRTRRKRHELAKLEQRIQRKQDEQARLLDSHTTAEDIMYGKGLSADYGTVTLQSIKELP
jgi:hypothetical protein